MVVVDKETCVSVFYVHQCNLLKRGRKINNYFEILGKRRKIQKKERRQRETHRKSSVNNYRIAVTRRPSPCEKGVPSKKKFEESKERILEKEKRLRDKNGKGKSTIMS